MLQKFLAPALSLSTLLSAACQPETDRSVSHIASDVSVCARAADGLRCSTWQGAGSGPPALWSSEFGDTAGCHSRPSPEATPRPPHPNAYARPEPLLPAPPP